ncbi:hypothetical protein EPO56_01610 [Patescibacteria group bacterium]|nr:MAG: hypothetical protein EPO56_01610 [Patescibacteria group bacterium]
MKHIKKVLVLVFAVLPLGVGAVSVNTSASTETSASVPDVITTSVSTDADVSAQGSMVDESSTDTSEASSKLFVNTLGVEVIHSSQVATDADLEVLNENIKVTNANIVRVDAAASNDVVVEYKHRAKFLGLFSVTVVSKTKVTANENEAPTVKTTLPWWSFLTTGSAKVRDAVDISLTSSPTITVYTSASVSAKTKAELVEEIVATLETQAQLSAGAEIK